MLISHPAEPVFVQKSCVQPEARLKSHRNILNCCLNSAALSKIRQPSLTVANYFGFFISEWQTNEEKGNSANVFEISGYLCLLSIRDFASNIYATTAKELWL